MSLSNDPGGKIVPLGKEADSLGGRLDRIMWSGASVSITLECSEFVFGDPVTQKPISGEVLIEYVPHQWFVQRGAVADWLWRWRESAMLIEQLVPEISVDFFKQIRPIWVRVECRVNTREWIGITVSSSHGEYP